jgi:hypothetical protein
VILERAKGALSTEEHEKLESAVDTLAYLTLELEAKAAHACAGSVHRHAA